MRETRILLKGGVLTKSRFFLLEICLIFSRRVEQTKATQVHHRREAGGHRGLGAELLNA